MTPNMIKTLLAVFVVSLFSYFYETELESSPKLIRQTSVALGPSESLLITDADAEKIRAVMVNPENAIGVRSVTIDAVSGSVTVDPVTGQYLGDITSFARLSNNNKTVLTQVTDERSTYFTVQTRDLDSVRFDSFNSIPSLPLPLLSADGKTAFFPTSINESPRNHENLLWAQLNGDAVRVSSLLYYGKIRFGSYRLAESRVYFLDCTNNIKGDCVVSYVDIDSGESATTDLFGRDIAVCQCGVWILDDHGSAILHDPDGLHKEANNNRKRLTIPGAKFIFGRSDLSSVGGVCEDGSFWYHHCRDPNHSRVARFVDKTDVAGIVAAGWVAQRNMFWIQARERLDDELELVAVKFFELADIDP